MTHGRRRILVCINNCVSLKQLKILITVCHGFLFFNIFQHVCTIIFVSIQHIRLEFLYAFTRVVMVQLCAETHLNNEFPYKNITREMIV
jgi:hypothetical protein